MRYMLDTDICIYISKQKPATILRKLNELSSEDACLSAITYAELRYGAEKSHQRSRNLETLSRLRTLIRVLPFEEAASEEYGIIRAHLEKKGRLIGGNDLLIASHAKSLKLTLVTNNVREFKRVPGLSLELWM